VEVVRKLLHRDRMSGQAIRFVIVGLLNTVVDLGAFYALSFVMPNVAAKAISYVLGIANSFFWNKYWTFGAGRSSKGKRELALFVLVNIPPLVVNVVVFSVLGIWLGSGNKVMRMVKAFAAAIIAVVWNFLGSRYLAFRHTALKGTENG
jgi:putative flippase GtrA